MAEKIDVEITGKSQLEVAYEMAQFVLVNMESRQVKNIKREELLHLVATASKPCAASGSNRSSAKE